MLTVAIIGLIVNIVLTIVLSRSTKKEENLNIKSALWHFKGHLPKSVKVIISAFLSYLRVVMEIHSFIRMVIEAVRLIGGVNTMSLLNPK